MASYSPVFSSQFIVGNAVTGVPSFDVPSGFTAVVRDFSGYLSGLLAISLLYIQNSLAAPATCVAVIGLEGVAAYDQWQGRAVCPEGGRISITYDDLGGTPDFYVGGYLLRNNLT